MAVNLPNEAKVYIASAVNAEKRITAITNANPPLATCTAHGLNTGDFIVLTTGWGEFNERVFKIESASADTFKILGVDARNTTKFPAGQGVGSFQKVNAWAQIQQILNVNFSGGEQQYATYSFLEENFERQIPTSVSARSVTFSIGDDPSLAGYIAAKNASETRSQTPLRIDLKSGEVITYYGYAALNEVPNLEKNNVMAVNLAYALSSQPVRY